MPLTFRCCGFLVALLLCAGICGAVPLAYSISCPQLNVGPDTIQSFTQNGTVDLPPNTSTTNDTIDFYNASTQVNRNNANATFNATLACTFTLGGVVTQVNRPFQLVVSGNNALGAQPEAKARPSGIVSFQETHTFTFQPYSFTVNIPGQGTVAVSGNSQIDSAALNIGQNSLSFAPPFV